jgi:hypothetical protein
VNPATVPTAARSYETSHNRSFFDAILHELFRVLGFSSGELAAWINAATVFVYNSTGWQEVVHDIDDTETSLNRG